MSAIMNISGFGCIGRFGVRAAITDPRVELKTATILHGPVAHGLPGEGRQGERASPGFDPRACSAVPAH